MNKTRASRGAKAGLELMSAVAADRFDDTAKPLDLQASILTQRYRLSPAVAAATAALAYPILDTWRARA